MSSSPDPQSLSLLFGLGSNMSLDDGTSPIDILQRACIKLDAMLPADAILDISRSSIYKSPPWGPISDQSPFFNCVLRIEVDATKTEAMPQFAKWLLAQCNAIETDLGRDRDTSTRYGPRTVDIDILLIGAHKITLTELSVPHPEYLKRDFVLIPAIEIAAEMIDPNESKRLKTLLAIYQADFTPNNLVPIDPGISG